MNDDQDDENCLLMTILALLGNKGTNFIIYEPHVSCCHSTALCFTILHGLSVFLDPVQQRVLTTILVDPPPGGRHADLTVTLYLGHHVNFFSFSVPQKN